MPKRVFIAERNDRYPFEETVAPFGWPVYILTERISPFNTDEFVAHVKERLEELNFDPAVDLFCIGGYILSVTLVMGVMAEQYKELGLLFYGANEGRYQFRQFSSATRSKVSV